jgi:purine-binding chemotaxis protein CheW
MSEARKRAQKKGTGAAGPPEPPSLPPAASEPEPEPAGWVSREETLLFPDEPEADEPVRSGRISLPSSGLAEDILARADAAAIAPQAAAQPAPAGEPMAPAAPKEDALSRAHNISFFAAPAREEKKAIEATEHLVTFYLADEEYGVDVRLVQEIIRVAEITQIPRAPEFIKGVINLRGRIIPVVDLKRKLNLGDVEHTRQARIVVVKIKDRLLGLLVDGASQVLKVPVSTIEPAPEEVLEIDANYIRGVAKLEKRLIILVDLQKILAFEAREAQALVAPA